RSDYRVVRVGPAVAVERPPVADLADLVQVELADDQLGLVRVADLADELSLGVDEVALPVKVVLAEGLVPARRPPRRTVPRGRRSSSARRSRSRRGARCRRG